MAFSLPWLGGGCARSGFGPAQRFSDDRDGQPDGDSTGFGAGDDSSATGDRNGNGDDRRPAACVETSPIRLTDEPGESRTADIVWDGASYWIAWINTPGGGGPNWQAYHMQVASDGSILASTRPASSGARSASGVSIGLTAAGFAVAWIDSRTGSTATYLAGFDSTGTKLTVDQNIAGGAVPFLVGGNTAIGALVGMSFGIATPPEFTFGSGAIPLASAHSTKAITWTGSSFALVTSAADPTGQTTNALMFVQYDEAGMQIGSVARAGDISTSQTGAGMVWTGSGFGLVSLTGSSPTASLTFDRLDATGEPAIDRVVLFPTGFTGDPDIAWNGETFGIVYTDETTGQVNVMFLEVDVDGQITSGPTLLGSGGRASQSPAIVWSGSAYGVAWQESVVDNAELFFQQRCRP